MGEGEQENRETGERAQEKGDRKEGIS